LEGEKDRTGGTVVSNDGVRKNQLPPPTSDERERAFTGRKKKQGKSRPGKGRRNMAAVPSKSQRGMSGSHLPVRAKKEKGRVPKIQKEKGGRTRVKKKRTVPGGKKKGKD